MEQILPPRTQHGSGYELTRVRQFTIFLENKVGRLQTLVRAIEGEARIAALSIEESGDAALVRMVCATPDLCRDLLLKAGFSFSESELLAVELPKWTDRPLIALCAALLAAELNIHYAYPLLQRPIENDPTRIHSPAIAFYCDDPTLAAQLLIKKGFRILAHQDL